MEKKIDSLTAKCAHCHEVITVSHFKEFKSCKCGAIALDFGDGFYYRMCGGIEDFDAEYDKAHGIDRFAQFQPAPVQSNAEFYVLNNKPYTVFGREVMSMTELCEKVWEWFDEKGLHDPVMQMVKVQEEVGELAHEITRGHRDSFEVVDSLGDIMVTIIGMCHHLNIPPEDALSLAYSEIKDRKGKVVEGSFVKDES